MAHLQHAVVMVLSTYRKGITKRGCIRWMRFREVSSRLESHELDAIFVRSVNEVEVKPKPKVYPNLAT
ncbi:hypothetical protein Ccrd_018589 [Cynara cardunculus var. scolymus]|uniref:Uncharacterized protein n=1 Tax=Cynara cardunculus var. scolymus TaxID=59895 RepID=A0A118K1M3_CYNCS|nr:hypothetical protein Ccrd_018589 [Cynara cardunculus var. scolymus]